MSEDSAPDWHRFGYAGALYDSDTRLVRFRARDDDALSGRWIANDPSGWAGGLKLYEYAAGDPVDGIDTDGNASPVTQAMFDIPARLVHQAALSIGGLTRASFGGVLQAQRPRSLPPSQSVSWRLRRSLAYLG